jgi:hypothetical protein
MRWRIVKTLLHKEVLRHLANRGGLALVLLLLVASMLLSFFGNEPGQSAGLAPGVRLCYVDYWQDSAFLDHLRDHVPEELVHKIRFRPVRKAPTDARGTLLYPQNTGAIQLRPLSGGVKGQGTTAYKVWFWHPGADGSALAPFEVWFWKEALRFSQRESLASAARTDGALPWSGNLRLETEYSELKGGLDPRSGMATALVLFGLFFVCVYLLPSLTCEERERGVLLAQALSPASTREILAAKFLFYPVAGLALAAVLAGTYRPAVLVQPFFWLALLACVAGSMGIGLTISSIARTQRAASMGAMCYMLAVAVLLFICQQNNIPGLPYLALEYHGPRMLHAALTDSIQWYHWFHLAGAIFLAVVWTALASFLFRRYGWQ